MLHASISSVPWPRYDAGDIDHAYKGKTPELHSCYRDPCNMGDQFDDKDVSDRTQTMPDGPDTPKSIIGDHFHPHFSTDVSNEGKG